MLDAIAITASLCFVFWSLGILRKDPQIERDLKKLWHDMYGKLIEIRKDPQTNSSVWLNWLPVFQNFDSYIMSRTKTKYKKLSKTAREEMLTCMLKQKKRRTIN
jgi:hypothetical protein